MGNPGQREGAIWLGLGALALAFYFLNPDNPPDFSDFAVYYSAGIKAIRHQTVFDVVGHYQFKYAPSIALLFGGVYHEADFKAACRIHYALSAFAWAAWLGFWARKLSPITGTSDDRPLLMRSIGISLLLFSLCLKDELRLGQINLIPLALLAFALHRPSSKLAGPAFALAVQFKLYCALAVPVLVFRGNWRLLAESAAWVLLISIGSVALWSGLHFSWTENKAWLGTLYHSSEELVTSTFNVSLLGVFSRWFNRSLGWAAELLGIGAFVSLAWKTRTRSPSHQFAFVTTAIPLLNPLAWPYWSVFGLPSLLLWLRRRHGGDIPSNALDGSATISAILFVGFNCIGNYLGKNMGFTLIGNAVLATALFQAKNE